MGLSGKSLQTTSLRALLQCEESQQNNEVVYCKQQHNETVKEAHTD